MVGKGPTKGEQGTFALVFGLDQVIFKFTVLVPRYKGMDSILSFQAKANTLFFQKGQINILIGYVQSKKLTGQVLQKPKGFPLGKILHILFIGIGFPFKTYILVGTVTVQIQYRTQQPFGNIKNIKR